MKTTMQKIKLLLFGMLISLTTFAQAPSALPNVAETSKYSPYTDPVFYALCGVAAVLLIFILQLQKVFAGVARNYARKNSNQIFPAIILILSFQSFSTFSYAQEAAPQATFLHEGFGSNAFNALIFLIIVEVAVVLYYVRMIQLFLSKNEVRSTTAQPVVEVSTRAKWWDNFNKSVAIEKEAAIMTDHNYDGIQELDNSLPPWWKYGFYLTIVWGVAYLIHYHVAQTGPLSIDEYKNQIAEAEIQMEEYRKRSADMVDEKTVTLLIDANELSKGKATFDQFCVACHGAAGEGKVGPNLTDAYWKHGGDIKDIFKTVKLGVSGTGMKSWKADLSPKAIAQVSSYILTLQGTNPANSKAPEGDLYQPSSSSDSTGTTITTAKSDTLKIASLRNK